MNDYALAAIVCVLFLSATQCHRTIVACERECIRLQIGKAECFCR